MSIVSLLRLYILLEESSSLNTLFGQDLRLQLHLHEAYIIVVAVTSCYGQFIILLVSYMTFSISVSVLCLKKPEGQNVAKKFVFM